MFIDSSANYEWILMILIFYSGTYFTGSFVKKLRQIAIGYPVNRTLAQRLRITYGC